MENNNNIDLSNKNDKKLSNKAQPKPTPKPEPILTQKIKEIYLLAKEKALETINTISDYVVNTFSDFYNSATNEPKPEPVPKQTKVQLNEEAVTQELIAKAKQDGDTKEAVLNNQNPNSQNMVGSSLVVDMDVQKVEATIKEMDQRLNQDPKAVNKVNEPQPELEIKADIPIEKENTVEKKVGAEKTKEKENTVEKKKKSIFEPPKPKPENKKKLKPEAPKPTPKVEPELKLDDPKPVVPTFNFQSNLDAIRNKFLKEQQNNPYILEEQAFQVVLKPQDPVNRVIDKDAAIGSIANIRKNLHPMQVPDTVENIHGVEQRKVKAKLK